MTQAELARRVGVQRAQVNKVERGTGGIGADRIPLVADALGVTTDVLYGREPLPTRNGQITAVLSGNGVDASRFLRNYRGFAELASDAMLLAGAGVTPTELAALGEVAVTVEREPTKQEVLSLLLFLRQWSKGAV